MGKSNSRPSELNFLGKTYKVEYVPKIIPLGETSLDGSALDVDEDLADSFLFGITYHALKKIQVVNCLDLNEEVDTTLHESIHMLDYILELGMTERQVKVLATSLVALLQKNQPLRKYLYENTSLSS